MRSTTPAGRSSKVIDAVPSGWIVAVSEVVNSASFSTESPSTMADSVRYAIATTRSEAAEAGMGTVSPAEFLPTICTVNSAIADGTGASILTWWPSGWVALTIVKVVIVGKEFGARTSSVYESGTSPPTVTGRVVPGPPGYTAPHTAVSGVGAVVRSGSRPPSGQARLACCASAGGSPV